MFVRASRVIGRTICVVVAVSVCTLAMTGCPSGLPAVTALFTLAEEETLSGTLVPLPLLGVPLLSGLSCNLPDEEDLEQAVRDAIGPSLSSIITIESAELSKLILEVAEDSPADFQSITSVEIRLYLLDLGGLRLDSIPLGTAEAPNGFGSEMELAVDPPVDIVEIVMANADCGAIAITATGSTPTEDVVFDVRARVRIQAAIKD